jgi:trans-2,3-dihydro-3-hydroxyanthranilate isomerase
MPRFPFYWIDAFTEVPLGGNPCVVVLDADGLTADQMQALARETNLSETAFVLRSERADFGARYFTPQGELPFAGHPTVATLHALREAGRLARDSATLELPAGIIPVEISGQGRVSRVTMSQLKPTFLRTYSADEALTLYGLAAEDLLAGATLQTVSTGTPILMVPLASLDALKRAHYPDPEAFLRWQERGDFMYAHHFCVTDGKTFARSLPTPPSTLEDPFTGSSTGCMAAYLWSRGLIPNARFVAEQGHWMGRPGRADVEVVGPPTDIRSVKVTGGAVTVMSGTLEL